MLFVAKKNSGRKKEAMMNILQELRFYIEVLAGERQGERIEIPLLGSAEENTYPWIHEDEEICFKLVVPYTSESPILWISDLPKPPSVSKRINDRVLYIWHPESRGYNRYQAFFLNCFGSCRLDIEIRDAGQGQTQLIELAPFEVKARKITAQRLREMIRYLASRTDALARAAFSVTRAPLGQGKRKNRVTYLLKEAEEGLHLFEQQLPTLIARYCTRLVPKRVICMPGPADYFDANTAEWLLSHLDLLIPAQDENDAVALIEDQPYTVRRLEVSELVEDSNVYENQVLHSYLTSIKTFLAEIRKECDRIQDQAFSGQVKSREHGTEDSSRYVSFSLEIKTSLRELFEGRKTKCGHLLEKCNYLMSILDIKIPVTKLLPGMPSLTPWIKANLHYRILFEKIIGWYQMGGIDWSDEEALAGVRSIDELYEYFCLYKLIDGLEKLGFRPRPDETSLTDSEFGHPQRRYEFEKGSIHITLYYEKEIWSPRHRSANKDATYLNVEGWVWDTSRRKGKPAGFNSRRVPDYIFEITANQHQKTAPGVLAIFDAKYSPPDTVFFEKLPVLVMRYVHGISRQEGGISPVISLYLLHPKEMEEGVNQTPVRSFYTEDYDIFGDKAVIPALGAAEVDPASDWDLSVLIERIVEIADRVVQDCT